MLLSDKGGINGDMFTAPSTYSGPDPGQLPGYVDDSGFDWDAGLGTISIAYYPAVADDYFLIAFFDHEILEPDNSYFNEFGATDGTEAAGQSWEIDEPGYVFGDIRTYEVWEDPPGDWVEYVGNVESGALDNYNNVPEGLDDDVSMALGWDFTLSALDIATVDFILSETRPTPGFFLSHNDPDSNTTIYFSSELNVTPVPEPATMLLVGTGVLGFGLGRKWFSKP